jgi:hypothetical protein
VTVSLLTPQHSKTTRVRLAGILTSLGSSGSAGPWSGTLRAIIGTNDTIRERGPVGDDPPSHPRSLPIGIFDAPRETRRLRAQKRATPWQEMVSTHHLLLQDVSERPRSFCLRKASGSSKQRRWAQRQVRNSRVSAEERVMCVRCSRPGTRLHRKSKGSQAVRSGNSVRGPAKRHTG